MTLQQYVKQEGGPERAAYSIGVTGMTVRRWLKGETQPGGHLVLERLKKLGIKS